MAFELSFKMKDAFFDHDKVIKALDKEERKSLSKVGAFIRRRSRSSIKRRKKSSSPGKPPHAHSTNSFATLKNIIFAYSAATSSVVVGPVKINGSTLSLRSISQTVPNLMETGGSMTITEERYPGGRGQWYEVRRSRRSSGRTVRRKRRINVKPRPFMGPALQKEIDAGTIPNAWAGVVSG